MNRPRQHQPGAIRRLPFPRQARGVIRAATPLTPPLRRRRRDNSAMTQSRTGITARGEANGSQEGKVIDFSSYQQKRRENDIAIPIKSPDTPPDEPIPSRLSPVPDLQTKQAPALEFVSLKFFESGQGLLAKSSADYSTRFHQQTARCIGFELTMHNRLYRQRDKRYAVKTHYVKPDGSDLMNHREETAVHSENEWFRSRGYRSCEAWLLDARNLPCGNPHQWGRICRGVVRHRVRICIKNYDTTARSPFSIFRCK